MVNIAPKLSEACILKMLKFVMKVIGLMWAEGFNQDFLMICSIYNDDQSETEAYIVKHRL